MSAEHVLTPDDKCPCGQPQEGSGYCSYECYSKHDAYAVRVEPAELAAIRERTEADFVTDPGSVSGDLAKELMQARLDRRALLSNFDAELEAHSTLDPEMPRPATQLPSSAPGTVQESTDRGTGELRPQDSLQTIDGRQLTGPEVISRVLVLAFGTRHNREHIGEIAAHLDAALRLVNDRAASASLRTIAEHRLSTAPDAIAYARAEGLREAALLLEHVADDEAA